MSEVARVGGRVALGRADGGYWEQSHKCSRGWRQSQRGAGRKGTVGAERERGWVEPLCERWSHSREGRVRGVGRGKNEVEERPYRRWERPSGIKELSKAVLEGSMGGA